MSGLDDEDEGELESEGDVESADDAGEDDAAAEAADDVDEEFEGDLDDDSGSDFDDVDDELKVVDEALSHKDQNARALAIRRAIEERLEAKRLSQDLDYLDLDLDTDD